MNRESIFTGIIGLLLGIVLTGSIAVFAVNNDNHGMMSMMQMKDMHHTNDEMGMDAMTDELRDKTGSEFDEAFISMMIVHHEGAVDMARLAEKNALHEEIKTLSRDIISAQESEIEMMKTWQEAWGYDESNEHGSLH